MTISYWHWEDIVYTGGLIVSNTFKLCNTIKVTTKDSRKSIILNVPKNRFCIESDKIGNVVCDL